MTHPQTTSDSTAAATPEQSQAKAWRRARTTPSPWLTVREAGDYVGTGRTLLYDEVKRGRLRAAKIGGLRELRIHRDWIDEWLVKASEPQELTR